MLSSGFVGNITLALNKSDFTSPADEHAAEGARPEMPQNDLSTTPSGRLEFCSGPDYFWCYFVCGIHNTCEKHTCPCGRMQCLLFQLRNRDFVFGLYIRAKPREKHLDYIQQAKRHRNLVLFPFWQQDL